MALVPTLKTWLLVVPALALLGVVGYRAGGHVRHDDTVPGTVDEAPVTLVSSAPMQAQQLARQLLSIERGTAVASGLPLDIRADIEGDTDLFAYAQRLQLQAANGNAEAAWMVSRVYDYCAIYAMDPGGYQLDNALLNGLGLTAAPAMVQARERVARRCGGFVASDGLGRQLILDPAPAGGQGRQPGRRGVVVRRRPTVDDHAGVSPWAGRARARFPRPGSLHGAVAGDGTTRQRRPCAGRVWWQGISSVNWPGGWAHASWAWPAGRTVC